ncbi:MAG: hypothetical protein QOI01_1845 [Mycobacterium sp.]|jgi:hypothetical protein|nr:hypothetical protein [Mycobacterium sp.]
MLELARALRPTERTPVRYPLSLANVPARMPLASAYTKNLPIYGPGSEGTTLTFSTCTNQGKGSECTQENASLLVQTQAPR